MSAVQRLLLVEDDTNLGLVLQEHLQMQGYGVMLAINGEDGLAAYRRERFDLLLVDVMMPKKDGFSLAREIRATDQDTPIIFLTAKSLKEDKIEGFRLGCDDYLTKPFSIEELLLRIRAVLRRSTKSPSADGGQQLFSFGVFTFDANRQTLTSGKTTFELTPKESELLRLLCLHQNQILEREVALREIWGDTGYFSGRSMDVFVSRLRKYLKADPQVELMGIHGKGFKLIVS